MKYTRRLTHLSLFTGIGGIDLAAEAAGFETVGQVEWADFPTAVLETHWPDVPRWRDIKTLTKEDFHARTGQRQIDLISGGFPCQPFSTIGRQRGFADDRYLWPEMFRVINELRPAYVLGENVAGFINMGLDKTLHDLESIKYAARTFVFPACAVKAWHERTRVFILGIDVSNAACQRHGRDCEKCKGISFRERSASQDKRQRRQMVFASAGNGAIPDADNLGRIGCETEIPPGCGYRHGSDLSGKAIDRAKNSESQLDGMAYGLPEGMDGRIIWEKEPENVPRITQKKDNWTHRIKSLGNAVVPQQVYPILKAIADIELGRCSHSCFFCTQKQEDIL